MQYKGRGDILKKAKEKLLMGRYIEESKKVAYDMKTKYTFSMNNFIFPADTKTLINCCE